MARTGNDPVTLSTQVDQLAGDIRYVQALAMTQGQRYRINLSATGLHLDSRRCRRDARASPRHRIDCADQLEFGSHGHAASDESSTQPGRVRRARGIPYTDNRCDGRARSREYCNIT